MIVSVSPGFGFLGSKVTFEALNATGGVSGVSVFFWRIGCAEVETYDRPKDTNETGQYFFTQDEFFFSRTVLSDNHVNREDQSNSNRRDGDEKCYKSAGNFEV